MLGIALAIDLEDWSVVAADLVVFGGCGLLDVGTWVYDMIGHCSTPAASSVAVVAPEGSYIRAGDDGRVQYGRCRLSSMPYWRSMIR
jgi:hypothetical protein